jgi:hypothetical protein
MSPIRFIFLLFISHFLVSTIKLTSSSLEDLLNLPNLTYFYELQLTIKQLQLLLGLLL